MRSTSATLALLLGAQSAGAVLGGPLNPGCILSASEQTFTGGSTTGWTFYDADTGGDCPVAGSAGNNDLRRTQGVGLGCSPGDGAARLDTDLGANFAGLLVSGCALVRYVDSGAGVGGTDPWDAPGIAFAMGPSTLATDYLYIACEDGIACDSLILGDGGTVEKQTITQTTPITFTAGDYMGACWTGGTDNVVATLEVRVWQFDSAPDADPRNWPAPNATRFGCPATFADCSFIGPQGQRTGLTFKTGSSLGITTGFFAVDNYKVWGGCETAGAGVFDEYEFPFNLR